MAANSNKAGSFGKRLAAHILASRRDPAPALVSAASASFRRAVHGSSYDKNVEEQICPAVVPDDVIKGGASSDKCWGPHPETGVFGPAETKKAKAAVAGGGEEAGRNGGGSVLDQKVWFRPQEDVDKTPVA